jgi:hypothetical protein
VPQDSWYTVSSPKAGYLADGNEVSVKINIVPSDLAVYPDPMFDIGATSLSTVSRNAFKFETRGIYSGMFLKYGY